VIEEDDMKRRDFIVLAGAGFISACGRNGGSQPNSPAAGPTSTLYVNFPSPCAIAIATAAAAAAAPTGMSRETVFQRLEHHRRRECSGGSVRLGSNERG
jgi:hypothetical protein